jgi:hypothetical protein
MLLEQRNLGLHRKHDVAQPGSSPMVRGDARENPRGTLLVHETACAVDRVHEQSPPTLRVGRPFRKREAIGWQTLRNEHQRFLARDRRETIHERGLTHAVYGVDGVTLLVVRDAGKLVAILRRECLEHRRTNAIVQREDRR